MFRRTLLTVALVQFLASPLVTLAAQSSDEMDVKDAALMFEVTYDNMMRGSDADVRKLLDIVKEPLRGTPHRLLDRLVDESDVKQAILGKPVPKPENQFRLAVLHPIEPKVVFVCDRGVIVIQDISGPGIEPVKVVTSRAEPLAFGAFSGDGKFFAVGDGEGGIVIWETETWKETKVIAKGTGVISYVALDRTGGKLIAETEEGPVLWDVAGGKEIGPVGKRLTFGGAFCFSADDLHFATGGLASVNIHDAKTGEKLREISHATHTMQLCFSSDGQLIASGLRGVPFNKNLSVFDVATGKAVINRVEHGRGITGVVFLDNDKCLLSTAADGVLRFWHVPSGTLLLRMKMSESVYQPTCHVTGSLILWNQRSGPRYFSFK